MFPKSKLYTDVVFLPNLFHLIPSTPVGNQFYCFLVYHSCISFCKGKQIDRIVFAFLFLSYTKGSGLYIYTFVLHFFPLEVTQHPFMEMCILMGDCHGYKLFATPPAKSGIYFLSP